MYDDVKCEPIFHVLICPCNVCVDMVTCLFTLVVIPTIKQSIAVVMTCEECDISEIAGYKFVCL